MARGQEGRIKTWPLRLSACGGTLGPWGHWSAAQMASVRDAARSGEYAGAGPGRAAWGGAGAGLGGGEGGGGKGGGKKGRRGGLGRGRERPEDTEWTGSSWVEFGGASVFVVVGWGGWGGGSGGMTVLRRRKVCIVNIIRSQKSVCGGILSVQMH